MASRERSRREREKKARRLIKLPVNKRPDNVKCDLPKGPKGPKWTSNYKITFDDVVVHFQHDGKRLHYLGEFPRIEKGMSVVEMFDSMSRFDK